MQCNGTTCSFNGVRRLLLSRRRHAALLRLAQPRGGRAGERLLLRLRLGRDGRRGGGCGQAGPDLERPHRVGRPRRQNRARRGRRRSREGVRSAEAQADRGGHVRRPDDRRVPHQGEGVGQARAGTAGRDQDGRRAEARCPGDELRSPAHGPPGAGRRAARPTGKLGAHGAAHRIGSRLFPRLLAHRIVLPRAHHRPFDRGEPDRWLHRRGRRDHDHGQDPRREGRRVPCRSSSSGRPGASSHRPRS